MSVTLSNMGLVQPTIAVDSGLLWEQYANANTSILDNHNHSPGNGVQIQPSGLNINSDLTFANNSAINLKGLVLSNQSSLATVNALYAISGNLYFNDGGSNIIQITSGGTVNATSSGISSGTATASFVSSVLVVNSASNTPANIQGGSILLGNNTPASKFLTLSPPSAMAANYTLTLPILPAQTNVMTIDLSGNMASITYNAVGQAMTATGANAIAATRTRATGSTVGIGGVAISSSCGNFNNSSLTFVDVTNLSVTITTSGRPVFIGLISDGTGSNSNVGLASTGGVNNATATFAILNGSTAISDYIVTLSVQSAQVPFSNEVPSSSINTVDFPAAGTYTYKIQSKISNTGVTTNANTSNAKLVAYEL